MADNPRFHARGRRGMVAAPDERASVAARDVLAEGGNAIEAGITASAVLGVVYPHMNGLGGDSFWLTALPRCAPEVIDAAGGAARAATLDFYRERGHVRVPERGPLVANTVAGTVAGWQAAVERARAWGGRLPLRRLLEPAIELARHGAPVASHLADTFEQRWGMLSQWPGFGAQFANSNGAPPASGDTLRLPRLAETLERLATVGCDDFYRGELAVAMAEDLAAVGSPLARADFAAYAARSAAPLSLRHRHGRVYNLGAPTQGAASLMILGLTDRLGRSFAADDADFVHAMVEATKLAFARRDAGIGDPMHVGAAYHALLRESTLDALARHIDMARAAPVERGTHGDTVWVGVVDAQGRAVSAIHSVYQEFGSGVVLPSTGLWWQNRGAAFVLDARHPGRLAPGARPLHTLNPAMADLADGRRLLYGVMGGDGQPQSQAAIFTRIAAQGRDLGDAVDAPRWLQGRSWGAGRDNLKLEACWDERVAEQLAARGHEIEWLPRYSAALGQAGAIAIAADGWLEGASDPRSDGRAVALT